MLKLKDFYHLAQLDPFFDRMIADQSGLIVIAGIDSRPVSALAGGLEDYLPGEIFLPSGLSGLFDILMHTMLVENPRAQAVVVARERNLARVPRQVKSRMRLLPVEGGQSYDRQIKNAIDFSPDLLVVDRLTLESAQAVFQAAHHGLKVLSSMDSALRGAGLVRHFSGLGIEPETLSALAWVLSMQRLPALCSACRQPAALSERTFEHLAARFPHLVANSQRESMTFWKAGTCSVCHHTGRSGDVAVFDVFSSGADEWSEDMQFINRPSQFSMEDYIFHLAGQGMLALDDLLWLETDQLRRTYTLLSASGQALGDATAALQRKLFELEASNRVLVQRTEVLVSLEDLGQALIESVGLQDLAKRICRRAGELCGADRAILYLLRKPAEGAAVTTGSAAVTEGTVRDGSQSVQRAEVLAARGWQDAQVQRDLDAALVLEPASGQRVTRYINLPPGVRLSPGSQDGSALQAGLRVPLMAQERLVGVMIIQSTQKASFTPGETALLQTFANQAALAIQRGGLVDELRARLIELETAQAELVKKERMERELELARQVQQSLLPRVFPPLQGYAVAARTQAARQVGGDFYDVIVLDEDHFGIVVADVSDKGMPAALYMGLSRSLLLAEAHRGLSPREALLSVNRLLLELGDLNGFVSIFYGVIEVSTRCMHYTRAGHEKPWLLRSGANGLNLSQLGGSGTVLGIMEGEVLNLSEEVLYLTSQDRLVLFTDGICDALDNDGRFFGSERLEDLLGKQAGQSAEQICEAVFNELSAHRGQADPFDDMTLLVLEVQTDLP
jgi:serine phosphatase RsbU (regulator of sigma subunit)